MSFLSKYLDFERNPFQYWTSIMIEFQIYHRVIFSGHFKEKYINSICSKRITFGKSTSCLSELHVLLIPLVADGASDVADASDAASFVVLRVL